MNHTIQDYQDICSTIHTPDNLKKKVLSIPEEGKLRGSSIRLTWKQIPVLVAVLILVLGLAACVYAVTDSIREEIAKNWSQSMNVDAPENIEDVTLPEVTTIDIKTGEEVTEIYHYDMYWYNLLLEYGKVYQFEVYLNDDGYHDHRFVKAFSEEELKGAAISPDHNWIEIQGKMYHLEMGDVEHLADEKEKEEIRRIEEGKIQPYDPYAEIRILMVYEAENWADYPGILADEELPWILNQVVIPLSEGRAAFYQSDINGNTAFYKGDIVFTDVVFDRMITEADIATAEVSLNGSEILINGELYVHVYDERDEDGNTLQLHLIPAHSYYAIKGSKEEELLGLANPEKKGQEPSLNGSGESMFYPINEWLEAGDPS